MTDLKITDVRVLPGDSGFLIDDGKTSILYDSGFALQATAWQKTLKKPLAKESLIIYF